MSFLWINMIIIKVATWAFVHSTISLLANQTHLRFVNCFVAVVNKLHASALDVSLDDSLGKRISKGLMHIFRVVLTASKVNNHAVKFMLDGSQNASNSSFGESCVHFESLGLALDLDHFTGASGRLIDLCASLVGNLVLKHVLVHHLVVELEWILFSNIVVDFSFSWLDHIGSLGIHSVGQRVVSHVDFTSLHLFVEQILVSPTGLLLVHETTGGRLVLLLIVSVELSHDLVELIHLEAIVSMSSALLGRILMLSQQIVKLLLDGSNFVLIGLVAEHVGATAVDLNRLVDGHGLGVGFEASGRGSGGRGLHG